MRNVGENLLPTIAYGDAAGLPFEGQRPTTTAIDELHDIRSNPFVGEYPAGTWSDDTHLSVAVAQSLIASKGFSLDHQASVHVQALRYVRGEINDSKYAAPILESAGQNSWGGSTTRSVERIIAGISPYDSGEVEGAGNGVLMKLAPLAYWQVARDTTSCESDQQIIDLTRMTHCAPEAIVSSLVHRDMLRELSESSSVDARQVYLRAVAGAKSYELEFDPDHKTSTVLSRISSEIESNALDKKRIVEVALKRGFYAPETLLMVYGSFVLEQVFPEAVYRGVELGGDADSVGSMLATMTLFASGVVVKPGDYDKLTDIGKLETASHELASAALNR